MIRGPLRGSCVMFYPIEYRQIAGFVIHDALPFSIVDAIVFAGQGDDAVKCPIALFPVFPAVSCQLGIQQFPVHLRRCLNGIFDQLEIGGRLIIPVGRQERSQRLLRITRLAADRYEEEDLGGVVFVPLIGEGGWAEYPIQTKKSLPERIAEVRDYLDRLWHKALVNLKNRVEKPHQ